MIRPPAVNPPDAPFQRSRSNGFWTSGWNWSRPCTLGDPRSRFQPGEGSARHGEASAVGSFAVRRTSCAMACGLRGCSECIHERGIRGSPQRHRRWNDRVAHRQCKQSAGRGWHSVQIRWESPGNLELNVSGTRVTAFKPERRSASERTDARVCRQRHDRIDLRGRPAVPRRIRARIVVSSTIEVERAEIGTGNARGMSVVVRLTDGSGNPLINGGDRVELFASRGAFGTVVDRGDGTYVATFLPGSIAGMVTIGAQVNGQSLASIALVTVIASSPGAPENLVVARESEGARLTWTVARPMSWDIVWSDAPDWNATAFETIHIAAPDTTTYRDANAREGMVYRYRVFTWNEHGDSPSSNVAQTAGRHRAVKRR